MIALVKGPVPVGIPCIVFVLKAMVGFAVVLQTTPYWVGVGAPSKVIVPFPVAVVLAILVTACVVTVGRTPARVVKLTSVPYEVPAEFVA